MQNDCSNCNLIEVTKNHESRIAKLETGQAVTDEKINNILELVRKIDDAVTKLQERPDPFKVWLLDLGKQAVSIALLGGAMYAIIQGIL